MLVAYTSHKLDQVRRPKNASPVIHIFSNGVIYLYKSLLKRLDIDPLTDKILFSHDVITNNWYLSKNDSGIKISYNNRTTHNLKFFIPCMELRARLIGTHSTLFKAIDTKDSFYMRCANEPTQFREHGSQQYYLIEIIK